MQVDLREQASDNLRFIRGAMERAGRVSVASGIGAMAMGAVALLAMGVATGQPDLQGQLAVWIAAAFAALLAGAVGSALKARRNDLPLLGDAGRRFLLCLTPSLVVGVVLTTSLWDTPEISLLPVMWMMLYGAGVLAAGTYAAPPVMSMGVVFLVAGLSAHALPATLSNVLLGAVFGGAHLFFGFQVYRHHGG
ncbi:MAG: hypothetical protein AB7O54_13890 [Pseudomonadales bacterium]